MTVPKEIQYVGEQIHFDATHHWLDGEFDYPDALIAALKKVDGLKDYDDELGNCQGAVRLDYDPDPAKHGKGLWVTVPVGTTRETIDRAAAGYASLAAELHPVEA